MPTETLRKAPRMHVGNLPVTLIDRNKRTTGTLSNVSVYDAYLAGCSSTQQDVIVEIWTPKGDIRRKCRIVRPEPTGCAIEFKPSLSHTEIAQIVEGYAETTMLVACSVTDMAQRDSVEVNEELRAIQGCRSNVFLATIGAMAAAVVTIGGYVGPQPTNNPAHVLLGLIMTFALFVIGVFATIEKARAINIRKAFLKVLSRLLLDASLPSSYLGWSRLKDMLFLCGTLHRVGVCVLGNTPDSKPRCKNAGLDDSECLHRATQTIPCIFDSFMSLSSSVYSAVYVFIVIGAGYSLAKTLTFTNLAGSRYQFLATWPLLTYISVAFGFLSVLFLLRWKWPLVGLALIPAFAPIVAARAELPIHGAAVAFIFGGFLGALGWYLLCQVYLLRRGKHSVLTYYYTWERIIQICSESIPEPRKLQVIQDTSFRNAVDRFFSFLFEKKPGS